MGRIFETRKHTMFARWDKMAKAFTRIGKEISIAVKSSGPDPQSNPMLRRVIQNARAVNMPKDKIESAIKRAAGQDGKAYEEILFEGYAPHGIAIIVETATDNNTRTVANLRSHFNKGGGNLGTTGSVAFMFKRMGVFRLDPEGIELYHLTDDIGETKNLADIQKAKVVELGRELETWREGVGAELMKPNPDYDPGVQPVKKKRKRQQQQ